MTKSYLEELIIMEIYTSNYARARKLPSHLTPVSISRGVPRFFSGASEKRLAPTWEMLKKPREIYDAMFIDYLSKLDAQVILNALPENPVLLCYETHNDWCHRRAVAEWFENELGIVVPEYGFDREDTFPYKECTEQNKGKLRTVELKKVQQKEAPATQANVVDVEPEAVRLRRESYQQEREHKPSIFDFEF